MSNQISLFQTFFIFFFHYFKKQCVSIIDHHTALDEFDQFFEDEHLLRGGCPTDVKAVRSMTSAYGREFDQHTLCYLLKPAFFEQVNTYNYNYGIEIVFFPRFI